jgi:cell division protein FtsL
MYHNFKFNKMNVIFKSQIANLKTFVCTILFFMFNFQCVIFNAQNLDNSHVKNIASDREILKDIQFELKSVKVEMQSMKSTNEQWIKVDELRFSIIEKLLYTILAMIFVFIGFLLWDRRAAFKPFEDKYQILDDQFRKLLDVIKDKAKIDKELEAALRFNNLL